jgi:hypothetical protein
MSKKDRENHDCYNTKGKKKGRKGRRCRKLIRMPILQENKVTGGEKV